MKLSQLHKFAVATHSIEVGYFINFDKVSILAKVDKYRIIVVCEALKT